MYVYIRSEPGLWTVGFYNPDGKWQPESDHGSKEEAAKRVHYLNGGNRIIQEAKNKGLQRTLDNHYAKNERLWQWARETLTGEIADQFWQIAANGHLMAENPEYHQRINILRHRVEELEDLLSDYHPGD